MQVFQPVILYKLRSALPICESTSSYIAVGNQDNLFIVCPAASGLPFPKLITVDQYFTDFAAVKWKFLKQLCLLVLGAQKSHLAMMSYVKFITTENNVPL